MTKLKQIQFSKPVTSPYTTTPCHISCQGYSEKTPTSAQRVSDPQCMKTQLHYDTY